MHSRLYPLAALAVLTLGGCKGKTEAGGEATKSSEGAGSTAGQATSIIVYSGRSEQLIGGVIAAYERASGVDVRVKYADSAQLAATLLEEGGNSPADVFLAQDASTLGFLDGKGSFTPLPKAVLDRAPASARSASGTWIGVSGRARVLAYNPKKLTPDALPKTADELTDPRWKGRVGWAPANASFQSFVAAMIQLRGEDRTAAWLEAMKKNQPKDYPKNTPAVMAVSTGEVDVALVNHYYLYRLRDEHGADLAADNHYFRSGGADSMVNLSGAAVLAASKKQTAGAAFIAYLLSDEGQQHFISGNHEFPVAIGVPSPVGLPAFDGLEAPALDLARLDDLEATVTLLRKTGVLR
ncbi:MAG TPA: iron ABC transporter substrate-binding protein [Kofleriaceae bacterium]|nr:iron ABC transporter substrate-binding protein [Kofleriaceae bacterium]